MDFARCYRGVFLFFATTACSAVLSPDAIAANWFKLRGTQPGENKPTIRAFGFVQPTYIEEYNDNISGAIGVLTGATHPTAGTTGPDINGDKQVPGTIAPDRKRDSDFFLRRARLYPLGCSDCTS